MNVDVLTTYIWHSTTRKSVNVQCQLSTKVSLRLKQKFNCFSRNIIIPKLNNSLFIVVTVPSPAVVLTVFVFVVAVPSPAVNVQAVPLSPQSIIVSWDPPRQPKGRIIKYLLLFSEADSPHSSQIEVIGTQKLLTGKADLNSTAK